MVLAIGGSDSSSGAGIQADLKALTACGIHAMTVITAITAQSGSSVEFTRPLSKDEVAAQLATVFRNYDVAGVKCGLLPTVAVIEAVTESLGEYCGGKPVVLDPVISASSGPRLMDSEAKEAILELLFPLTTMVTPNAHELEELTSRRVISMEEAVSAGRQLLVRGNSQAVLAKGGHFADSKGVDLFLTLEGRVDLEAERVYEGSFRGTGCALASAIVANLVMGCELIDAAKNAKAFVHRAIGHAYKIGEGESVLSHLGH